MYWSTLKFFICCSWFWGVWTLQRARCRRRRRFFWAAWRARSVGAFPRCGRELRHSAGRPPCFTHRHSADGADPELSSAAARVLALSPLLKAPRKAVRNGWTSSHGVLVGWKFFLPWNTLFSQDTTRHSSLNRVWLCCSERSYIILPLPEHDLNVGISPRQCKNTSHEIKNLGKKKCLTSVFFLARGSALYGLG